MKYSNIVPLSANINFFQKNDAKKYISIRQMHYNKYCVYTIIHFTILKVFQHTLFTDAKV